MPENGRALTRSGADIFGGRRARRAAGRGLFLLVALVSLYLLFPSLLEVFTSWRSLFDLAPEWMAVALVAEAFSFAAVWEIQRVALGARGWTGVALSQLAANSLGRVIPGGAAAAGAFQYRMLVRAGIPAARIVSGLTGASILLFGTMLALPLLSVPAILVGTRVERALAQAAFLGGVLFVLLLGAGIAAFVWNRPLAFVAKVVAAIGNRTVRRRRPTHDLPERVLRERDALREAFGGRWTRAVTASSARWIYDYIALVACLRAVDADPNASLVLLAYVGASLLAMIPLTPGGLGFVEAGLTGLLALAGVGTAEAAVATLAYRLVSFWLPLPVGGVAYVAFRRRYP